MGLFGKGGDVTNFLGSPGFQKVAKGLGQASQFLNGEPQQGAGGGQSLDDLYKLILQHQQRQPQQPSGPITPDPAQTQTPIQINPVQPALISVFGQPRQLQRRGLLGDYSTNSYYPWSGN